MTTALDLDAFAASVEAATIWVPSMNQQLATLTGGSVRTTDAFDSVFRLRPTGWRIGMGEDPVDPRIASVNLYRWDDWQPQCCTVVSNAKTLLLGLIACTARAHAATIRSAGWKRSLVPPTTGSAVMVRTWCLGTPPGQPQETNVYNPGLPGMVLKVFGSSAASTPSPDPYTIETVPLDGSDDPRFIGIDNLCPVVPL